MRIFVATALWLLANCALAQADLMAETAFADDARRVYHSQPAAGDYRLVKSAIKKVNNLWRAEEERLLGLVVRNTFILNDALTYREAREQLQNAAQASNMQTIFTCEGLNCGSSNGWANEYLNIKQLYGLDNYQYYLAVQNANSAQQNQVQVYYLVQRGNKRIYLQQDVITLKTPRVKSLAVDEIERKLRLDGAITALVLPDDGSMTQAQRDEMRRLVRLLGAQPLWRMRVVGHNYRARGYELRQAQSLQAANEVREQMLEQGAATGQITAHGLGSLVPTAGASDRVELVIDLATRAAPTSNSAR